MGRKKTNDIVKVENLKIENRVEIDYDKLAQAIVKATLEASEQSRIDEENEKKKKAEVIEQNRREYLKRKDFSHISCPFWRKIRIFLNDFLMVIRLIFIPKSKIGLFDALDELVASFTQILILAIRVVLYGFSIFLIIGACRTRQYLFFGIFAFGFFAFGQLFRIAQYEVNRLKDHEYTLALFVGMLTIVSIAISIFSLIPDSNIAEIKTLLEEITEQLLN